MFSTLFNKHGEESAKSNNWLFGTMLVFGIIGLIASFTLAVEEFYLIKNPEASLSCSFNLVLNCATVMKTWQASVFGFPNMYIGLMGFPMVIMIALLGLSKVKFPRWFLVGAQIGYVFWTLFAYWLFFNSVYVIQVLCPWCLLVTFSMTILAATITRHNLRENVFGFKKDTQNKIMAFLDKDYDKFAVAVWVFILVALVFAKFGDSLFA